MRSLWSVHSFEEYEVWRIFNLQIFLKGWQCYSRISSTECVRLFLCGTNLIEEATYNRVIDVKLYQHCLKSLDTKLWKDIKCPRGLKKSPMDWIPPHVLSKRIGPYVYKMSQQFYLVAFLLYQVRKVMYRYLQNIEMS